MSLAGHDVPSPWGEGGASAPGEGGGSSKTAPSPPRGEGWGEGVPGAGLPSVPTPTSPTRPLARAPSAQGERACGPFLSAPWLRAWQAHLPAGARVFRFGDGLLVRRDRAVLGVWPVRRFFLHESGDPLFDRLAVEDNGLPCRPGVDRVAALSLLLAQAAGEVVFGGVDAGFAADLHQAAGLSGHRVRTVREAPRYWVDLNEARRHGPTSLTWASPATRAAIRRSNRLYSELHVDEPGGVADALDWFAALRDLHVVRWQREGHLGAFANPAFGPVHRQFLAEAVPQGLATILRVRAGDRAIGYLYLLFGRGWAHSYQSGFVQETDNRLKPGLSAHAAAIAWAAGRGLAAYDLMAGEARYKRELATHSAPMFWLTATPDRWPWRTEEGLRRLKAALLTPRTPSPPCPAPPG